MNPYLVTILLAGIALLQATLAPHLSFSSARPQFMLLAVVSWSLLRGGREGAVWGFVGGLILDLLSGGPFGIMTFTLLLAGYLSGSNEINMFRRTVFLPIAVVLVATLLYSIVNLTLLQGLGKPVVWELAFMHIILPAMLLNLLVLPLVYLPLRHLHRMTSPPQMHWA